MRTQVTRRMRSEDGAVLPWFVIWLPVLIVFVVLVVDVGNWFEHKRHLQMQADAAALAGAGKFRLPNCDDAAIKEEARQYAGDHAVPPDETLLSSFFTDEIYNSQIGGTPATRMHALVNFDARALTDPSYPGDFWRSPDDDDGSSPCSNLFIEVKMTETDLPWFFGLPRLTVPWIDAHARVSLMQMGTATDLMPIAVPDPNPHRVAAMFVNECTSPPTVITTTELVKQTALDGGLTAWSNNGFGTNALTDPGPAPVAMPTTCTRVGVRVALSYDPDNDTDPLPCSSPVVDCYDLGGTRGGIRTIRSHPTTPGQATAPTLQEVELVPAATGCADAYFFSDRRPCGTIGVRARLDFGGTTPAGAEVGARINASNPWRPLTDPDGDGWWESAGTPFGTNGNQGPLVGHVGIQIRWKSDNTCVQGGGCVLEASSPVHQTFGASDGRSGPIKLAQVFDTSLAHAASFPAGTTQDLIVRIATLPSIGIAQTISDPVHELKIVIGQSSQSQALNCDTDYTNLFQELAWGCGRRLDDPATAGNESSPFAEAYTVNDGDLDCRTTNRTTLWGMQANMRSNPDWQCVATSQGEAVNQVAKGLNTRIFGNDQPTTCPPLGQPGHNNWSLWFDANYDQDADPRLVHVFLTPFGSFVDATGNDDTVPVSGFATFYVTGYTGQGLGFDNPCEGDGDDPVPGGDAGTIVGHFVKYISNVNNGDNGQVCDPNALAPCVAVLTG